MGHGIEISRLCREMESLRLGLRFCLLPTTHLKKLHTVGMILLLHFVRL